MVDGTDRRPGLWREWLWPPGVIAVVVITLLWLLLPGEGGAGWLWLPLSFAVGVAVAWLTSAPGRKIFDN